MNSVVRCERLHTVPQAEIRRVIGSVDGTLLLQINESLKAALEVG